MKGKKIISVVLCILIMFPYVLVNGLTTVLAAQPIENINGLKEEYYLCPSQNNTFEYTKLMGTGINTSGLDISDLTSALRSFCNTDTYAGIRWTGKIQPKVSGQHTFYITGDNGFRLWVNGQLIIDFWKNEWDIEKTSTSINLTAGQKYDFKLEYFQATGGANIHVSWGATGLAKEKIPKDCFYLSEDYSGPIITNMDTSNAKLISNAPSGTINFDGANLEGASVELLDIDGVGYEAPIYCDVKSSSAEKLTIYVPQNLPTGKVRFGVTNNHITFKTTPVLVTYEFGTDGPRSEYPRPDWEREKWLNLNGQWDFDFDKAETGEASAWYTSHNFSQKIAVPYPWESELSGINNPDYVGIAWYQRELTLDNSWSEQKLMLNFGAVDWKCKLWINNILVGTHEGGYSEFSFDITDYIIVGSTNKITLMVEDNRYKDSGKVQLVGKQGRDVACGYTHSSGIWQTVYLTGIESDTYYQNIEATPDIDNSSVTFAVDIINESNTVKTASVQYNFTGTLNDVANGSSFSGIKNNVTLQPGENSLSITAKIPKQQLWNADTPNLYEGTFILTDSSGAELDSVGTYFGQRKISLGNYDGRDYQYIYINNEPVFLSGLLNQGFWKDGIYTAPTDAAIKSDLQEMKKLGFNMLRNHIKIEDPRQLYWADKLGLFIWEDMPYSFSLNTDKGREAYEYALENMLDRDYNHPCVISIILFNETWGFTHNDSFYTWEEELYNKIKSINPQLLVEDMSACNGDHMQPTDLFTFHMYPSNFYDAYKFVNTVDSSSTVGSSYMFRSDSYKGEPWLNSEYGGVGAFSGDGDVSWCFKYQTTVLRLHERLNGYVYTEPYDIEYERNGILNYDRTHKIFGYEDVAYGGDMSLTYLNQPDFIGFYNEPIAELIPGSVFTGKVGAINWSGNNYSNLTMKYRFDGTDSFGNSISTGIEGSMPIDFIPYTTENKTFSFTIPNTSKYSKFVGTVTVWIEDEDGNVIAKNYTNINVSNGSTPAEVTKLENNSFILRQASLGSVTDEAVYTYTVPEDMDISSLKNLKVIAELSSDKQGNGQTSEGEEVPSDVTISINGHEFSMVTLPDGPVDARGILSLSNSKASAGHYGYLLNITVPDSIIEALRDELENDRTITVKYEIKDGAKNQNGIRFFGEAEGRYAVTPMIILNPAGTTVDSLSSSSQINKIDGTDTFTNGSVEATVTASGSNSDTAGITARVTDGKGYYASVTKDGTTVSITKLNGTVVKTVTGLSLGGGSHKLKLVLADDHLQLFVDDAVTPVIDQYDYSYGAGSIGVYNTGSTAKFNDIYIQNETYGIASDDSDAAEIDANLLNIKTSDVTGDIALPISGDNGTTITWSSSNTDIISNTGTVRRPSEDTVVVLTATVTKGNKAAVRTFNVTVKSEGQLELHYNMDSSNNNIITDNAGNMNGTIIGSNGKIVYDSERGNVLQLSNNSYVSLPSGVMADYGEMTVCAWIKVTGTSIWQRVFDFGSSSNNYIMITAKNSNSGALQLSFKNGDGTEQCVIGPKIAANTWVHVAMTYMDNTAILYVNGVEVARVTDIAFAPSELGSTTQNYIGKSQYADPYYNGYIDDFRIYSGALSAEKIVEICAEKPVTAVAFGNNSIVLAVGQTTTNALSLTPSDVTGKTIAWTSSNTDVATVDSNGKVTAKSIGKATITATCEGLSATYILTVERTATPDTGDVFTYCAWIFIISTVIIMWFYKNCWSKAIR